MWIALTCKIYIAWGMNSFILPHPFINFCILLWREKVFPIDLMLSLIRRKIIYRVQHILVPKRQVLFLTLTGRWKRADNIFRDHKSEVYFSKKTHLHQWNIAKVSVLGSIKYKLIFKKTLELSIIYDIYPPIHLFIYCSVCMSVYGEYDCLFLPSFPMPKRQSLRFVHWTNINCLSHCLVHTSTCLPLVISVSFSLVISDVFPQFS